MKESALAHLMAGPCKPLNSMPDSIDGKIGCLLFSERGQVYFQNG